MTTYPQALSASFAPLGGQVLYPSNDLYPSDDLYPVNDTIAKVTARRFTAVVSSSGVLGDQRLTLSFAAILAPSVVFSKTTARRFTGALSMVGGFSKAASTTFLKSLSGALVAAGSLHAALVVVEIGGGGYATPMGEAFFRRYRPTIRKQR